MNDNLQLVNDIEENYEVLSNERIGGVVGMYEERSTANEKVCEENVTLKQTNKAQIPFS